MAKIITSMSRAFGCSRRIIFEEEGIVVAMGVCIVLMGLRKQI